MWGVTGALFIFFSIFACMRLVAWAMPTIMMPPSLPRIPVDERQQAVRDRSFRRAYLVVFLSFLIAGTMAYIWQDDLPGQLRRLSETNLLLAMFSHILILLASLPAACLAWTEPDESDGKPMEEIGAGESSVMG
jgi:hypothetical protein